MSTVPKEECRKEEICKNIPTLLHERRIAYLENRVAELKSKALTERTGRLLVEEKLQAQNVAHVRSTSQTAKKLADVEAKLKHLKRENQTLKSQMIDIQQERMELEAKIKAAKQGEQRELRMRKTTSKGKLPSHAETNKEHKQTERDVEKKPVKNKRNENNDSGSEKSHWECPVCFEPRSASTQLAATPCGHVFCMDCILQVIKICKHCPICNKECAHTEILHLFIDSHY